MRILILFILAFLSACFDDTRDLIAHMEHVKTTTTSQIEPIPEIHPFNHFAYSSYDLRSPFVLPEREVIQQKIQQKSGCLSPNPQRRKQPLEKFSLSELTMRGTMGDAGILWALVEASDLSLHRVSKGSYLGLFNGRISQVSANRVKVIELTPDGAGCWVERETVITMTKTKSEG